jgi:hypothetical protein
MPRVVVRGKLRRQPVPRVCEAGADRHEHARRSRCGSERQGGDRDGRNHKERDQEAWPSSVIRAARRSRRSEQRRANDDRNDRRPFAAAHRLVQPPRSEREEEDEAPGQKRLDECERRVDKRQCLQPPARKSQARSEDPQRARNKTSQEREAQRLVGRGRAHLRSLQDDTDRVEGRRAARGDASGDQTRHGQGPR